MKSIIRTGNALVIMFAIACGYSFHAWHGDISGSTSRRQSNCAQSFSEIDNAKACIRDLFYEFMGDLVDQQVFPRFKGQRPNPLRLQFGIDQLRSALAAFKGTEQELWAKHQLLWALQLQGSHGAWLDQYLGLLYCHPTDPGVDWMRAQAAICAKVTGRQTELDEAFAHLSGLHSALRRIQPLDENLDRDVKLEL